MSVTLQSTSIVGLDAVPVAVEVDVSFGIKAFHVVGLPDRAIRESCNRVEAALKNSGLPFPRYKITVNLAPAHLKKQGPSYDLAIALGILQSQGELDSDSIKDYLVLGELGLDGSIRPVNGVLSAAQYAKRVGNLSLVVPQANAQEAALVQDVAVFGFNHIKQLVAHLTGVRRIEATAFCVQPASTISTATDFQDVRGQEFAKRAFEIAAAGAHNLLVSGPPGSGKTLLARSLPSILPDMTTEEALDVTRIHSVAGKLSAHTLLCTRPFQSPHHTTSGVALVGGGAMPKPGQISLAHRGVLFLDEFPEFSKQALENLRQPLEDGVVTVSRAAGTVTFPAQFMLVAAMNPCPCGYATDASRTCLCTPQQIARYQRRLSGPLLDRIDLHVEVPRVDVEKLTGSERAESSKTIRERVQAARELQLARYADSLLLCNADLGTRQIQSHVRLEPSASELLKTATRTLQLSARSYMRTLKVSRTIADLASAEEVSEEHVAEALRFRSALSHAAT